MRAGQLRHRITIERSTLTPDAYGQPIATWLPWQQVWASIDPIGGREFEFARSFASTVSHKITIRFLRGLETTDRIRYGERLFAINAALNTEERERQIVVFATEYADPQDAAVESSSSSLSSESSDYSSESSEESPSSMSSDSSFEELDSSGEDFEGA